MKPTAAILLALALPAPAGAQAWADEATVGSERETYVRVARLAAGLPRQSWEIRPFKVTDEALPAWHPWHSGIPRSSGRIRVLRPRAYGAFNSAFAWRTRDALAWQGKGTNAGAVIGAAADFGPVSARLAPSLAYAANRPFDLDNSSFSGLRDALQSESIDLPQRFGTAPVNFRGAGESFVRVDSRGLSAGLSNETIFWGPGVRHALLFAADAPGFPHVFAGTSRPFRTPIGSFHGQLLYSRLSQSEWAPPAPSTRRFGGGVIGTWQPPRLPLTIGAARFYHRPWPRSFHVQDVLAPLGPAFKDPEFQAGDVQDNQLGTAFFSLHVGAARMEIFGEFARNDRSVDLRDLVLETEHNAAWLAGFLKAFAVDTVGRTFWTVRYEAANGRISAIQSIPRRQSTFFEHTRITQGHTHGGMLLGTPLAERSQGSELSVDRWWRYGRHGLTLLQRQMPADREVWMTESAARTQWDLSVSALYLLGGSEITYRLGQVWDLNRFPGDDRGNFYFALGWRQGLGNLPLP